MPEIESLDREGAGHTLLVWDAVDLPPDGDWITVLWRSFTAAKYSSIHSIPAIVEEQADVLKARYLAWVHELGETSISGKRVVDYLQFHPGFSYWWMTSIAQKFNAAENSQINNAIKLMVFEDIVVRHSPSSIRLVTGNSALASILKRYCAQEGLGFHWDKREPAGQPGLTLVRCLYTNLPAPVQALCYFWWYSFRSIGLLGVKHRPVQELAGEITFVDMLVHLGATAFTTGNFVSHYWTTLVDLLDVRKIKSNWIHNYFNQKKVSTFKEASYLTEQFTDTSQGGQYHLLAESNLSLSVFIKALRAYFKIVSSYCSLLKIGERCKFGDYNTNFWPLLKEEWVDSMIGHGAMTNCLRYALYEKIFRRLPHQKKGVYIQENQPWEMALIHFWKDAGHGMLIGVPHSTVRYWDLRYFYDQRSYARERKNCLPMPDMVAVNGPVAKQLYLEGGYPEQYVTEVEALRFLHIVNRLSERPSGRTSQKVARILICGDFLTTTTYKMLTWILKTSHSLPSGTTYMFKPHPAYPVSFVGYESLNLKGTNSPLAELLADCDIVFTSNITSAAVDAYCSGVPVVQMLDGDSFNMSPLRGLPGVVYVSTAEALAEALLNPNRYVHGDDTNYFCLDKGLSAWHKLLGLERSKEGA